MTILTPLALFGWIPIVLIMFAIMPSIRAVSWALILSWMYLPMAGYSIAGLPDYTKVSASSYAILLATILFDPGRFRGLKFCWLDPFVLIGIIGSGVSSLTNDIGMHDALSVVFSNTVFELIPYVLGRMYIRSMDDIKTVGSIYFIASLIYLPLVIYEMRMSPQLHRIVYGYFQHAFGQTKRGDAWRPMVFMQHGLMLTMWLANATVIAFWLWKSKTPMGKMNPWMGFSVLSLFVVTLLCRSTGATTLMLLGMGVLWLQWKLNTRWLLIAIAIFPASWTLMRTSGLWSGELLMNVAGSISSEREGSLNTRIRNENSFSAKAMMRPYFGWSGYAARYFPTGDEKMGQRAIPDGYWIILMGKWGLVGLGAWLAMGLIPCWMLVRNWPVKYWSHPQFAIVTAIIVVLAVYQIDGIFNAMRVTFWTFVIGGMMTLFQELGKPAERMQMGPQREMKAPGRRP